MKTKKKLTDRELLSAAAKAVGSASLRGGELPVPGFTLKQEKRFAWECYQNFPEASMSLICENFDYDAFRFEFLDQDDGKRYVVREDDAVRGLRLLVHAVSRGELPGLGLPAGYLADTGDMDAWAFDAINQFAIFGEVIYG